MCSIRSFQDIAKDCTPSRCSWAASAISFTLAWENLASTISALPSSSTKSRLTSPCSAKASNVFSGTVLTVTGETNVTSHKSDWSFCHISMIDTQVPCNPTQQSAVDPIANQGRQCHFNAPDFSHKKTNACHRHHHRCSNEP